MSYRLTFQPFSNIAPTTTDAISISVDFLQTLNIGAQSTGAGAGKITFNPLSFTRRPDSLSPQFFAMCCSGTPFRKVTLEATTPGAAAPSFTFHYGPRRRQNPLLLIRCRQPHP